MVSGGLLISLLWGVVWFLSGLILNFLQLLLYLFIKPLNPTLFRSLNYYLTYSSWSQVVVLAEFLSGSRVRVFYADPESEKLFGTEHTICVSNHKFETDWLFSWMVVEKLSCLGVSMVSYRLVDCVSDGSIRGATRLPGTFDELPSCGCWSIRTNVVYFVVNRQPKESPRNPWSWCQSWVGVGSFATLFSSPETGMRINWSSLKPWMFWWTIFIRSSSYCSVRGHDLPPISMRHQLISPSRKGFTTSNTTWFLDPEDLSIWFTILKLQTNVSNLETLDHWSNWPMTSQQLPLWLMFSWHFPPKRQKEWSPTFSPFWMARNWSVTCLLRGSLMIKLTPAAMKAYPNSWLTCTKRRLDLWSYPTECNHCLMQDQLMEYHEKNGKFPGEYKLFEPRMASLVNWLFWFTLIVGGQLYGLWHLILNQNYAAISIYLASLLVGVWGLTKLAGTTRSAKGSSYGGTPNRTPEFIKSKEDEVVHGQSSEEILEATVTNGKSRVTYKTEKTF